MSKRQLQVHNLGFVRTHLHQITSNAKRRKLTEHLWTSDVDEKAEIAQDTHHYLTQLHIYLLALCRTGVEKLGGAPSDDKIGSDTIKVVAVPLDIAMQYYWRAQRSAHRQAPQGRLQWLSG